jgi:hypothetical protein
MNYAAPSGPISTYSLRLMHSMSMCRVRYPVRNAWSLTITITTFTANYCTDSLGKEHGKLAVRPPLSKPSFADALSERPSTSVPSAIICDLPRLRGTMASPIEIPPRVTPWTSCLKQTPPHCSSSGPHLKKLTPRLSIHTVLQATPQ